MANFKLCIFYHQKKRNKLLTRYTLNILIKDNLEYTVLRKEVRQEYTLCASNWPCMEKCAIPGMLNPEEHKKHKYNLQHRKVAQGCRWEAANSYKGEKGILVVTETLIWVLIIRTVCICQNLKVC